MTIPTAIKSDLRQQLDEVLAQDISTLQRRSSRLFDDLRAPGRPIVLMGAGGLGRKILDVLVRHGLPVCAVADNNERLHGSRVLGHEVISPALAAQRYAELAVFVVTVFVGSGAVRRQLEVLGCKTVLPFYPLFWRYADDLLPHYVFDRPEKVLEAAAEIRRAFALLTDEPSRERFVANIRWRLDPETSELPPPEAHEIYFPPDIFDLHENECFVDCGAFDGDSLSSFIRRAPGGRPGAVAFEPDPINFRKLVTYVRQQPVDVREKIEVHQAAVGAHADVLRLMSQNSTSSSLSGTGEIEVPCLVIDEVLGSRVATFIKMDIEGSEPEAIQGAAGQIRTHQPLLALSAYHSQEDLWRLPLLVNSISPGYRFYLRHYAPEPVDALVVYAVPASRAQENGW